ncbi:C-X-C motif chemokine 9, partial [Dissostichus eleginoides]
TLQLAVLRRISGFVLPLTEKMSSSQKTCTLLLVVVAAVCIQLYQAQALIGRCSCTSVKLKNVKGNKTDFKFLEKRPGCDRTEFIVTKINRDNTTQEICVDTDGAMFKAFSKCWERINKDESRKMECINRSRTE